MLEEINSSNKDKTKQLEELKIINAELNNIILEKTKGTIIRSRTRWHGEEKKTQNIFLIWKSLIVKIKQ